MVVVETSELASDLEDSTTDVRSLDMDNLGMVASVERMRRAGGAPAPFGAALPTVSVGARAVLPGIRVVNQKGRGKGDALRSGFTSATGDIIVMLDAEGSTLPTEIPAGALNLPKGRSPKYLGVCSREGWSLASSTCQLSI